ncbi:MAG: TspO/MBR family protein [Granulosicoccus sp.]
MWWVSYAVTAAALVVVGGVGGKATEIGPWYRSLRKPSWNPPDWAFPVVWTTIYLFIIYSVGRVWNAADPEQHGLILMLVGVNFLLNIFWSVFFFTMKKPLLALFEVLLLWLSIIAMMIGFVEIDHVSAWMLVPYLAWVSVAAVLNLSIVRLNPTSNTS